MTDPIADVDRRLAASLAATHRARWFSVGVLAVIVVAAIVIGAGVIVTQQNRLRASCQFFAELGTINITPPKQLHSPPGRLSVELQVHSRDAYRGQGCGQLPAPYPALRQYARLYHIPLRG